MKKLYYSSCSTATPHMDVLINSIYNDIEAGHEIYFSYCDRAMSSCFKNMNSNEGLCKLCKFSYNHVVLKKLQGLSIIPVRSDIDYTRYESLLQYTSIQDLKELKYKDVFVGLSILSHFFTRTRNVDIVFTDEIKRYFDTVIKECCAFIDKIEVIVSEIKPDCICFYNGRYYETRPLLDIARNLGIPFESYEIIGGPRSNKPFSPIKFENCLPHDIHYFARNAKRVWVASAENESNKIEKAESFYEKRRHGETAGDFVYTKMQQEGLLPDVDQTKKSIVIFNSSTDEMAAVGDEWDSLQLFESQYDAIEYMLSNVSEKYHFYLRIHPNLLNVQAPHHMDLYKLADNHSNITIIPPSSPISSYALLDIAEKVIVFGSTMGVEACYWGKPVVLIGAAFYLDLDVCYRAVSKDDLLELIKNDLIPKDKKGALLYSYYLQDYTYRVEKTNYGADIDFQPTVMKVFNRVFYLFKSYRIMGSYRFFKLFAIIWRQFAHFFCKDRNKLPGAIE